MKYFLLCLLSFSNIEATVSPLASEQNPSANNQSTAVNQSVKSDEKMKLMYQVFTYASDLENAYKVAKKAVVMYPESLYWHKKMAEVSQWLDKRAESIKHYNYIYARTQKKALREKILDYAVVAYQYETAAPLLKEKVMEDPSMENIKKMISIYNHVGMPEVAAETLELLATKESNNTYLLKMALDIYIEMEEEEDIERLIAQIKKEKNMDLVMAEKLSHYYLSKKEIDEYYRVLLQADPNSLGEHSVEHYEKLSDFGWYLQDFKDAAYASKQLYRLGEARLVDYERILYYFQDKEPLLIEQVTLDGYKKFDKHYLYMVYLNTLFAEKKYKTLAKAFEKMEHTPQNKKLESELFYWLMKGQTYNALKMYSKAEEAFKRALELEPNSATITSTLLWFYIDTKDMKNVKEMIFTLEENGEVDPELYLPVALGHYTLQKSDRAMRYVKRLMDSDKNSIDIKFIYAYIMQVRGDSAAFMGVMREVFNSLEKEKLNHAKKMHEKVFLEHYLTAGMYFIDVDSYTQLLDKSKAILGSRKHTELSIFWALHNNSQSRAFYLAKKLKEIEPWMQLNMALYEDSRTQQLDILYRHFATLPIGDAVIAAVRTKNISFAQTLAFQGLENNRYDSTLYKENLNLVETYADVVDFKTTRLKRSNIDQDTLHINTRYSLENAWSIFANLKLTKNTNTDFMNLQNIPKNDKSFDIGLRKQLSKGYVGITAGTREAMENFYYFSSYLHYSLTSRLTLDVSYKNNVEATETLYLLLGGMKETLHTKIQFQYLPSTSIALSIDYDTFSSQDHKDLGDGYRARVEWYKQIRNGYPDMAWGLFYEYGNYSEKDGPKGTVGELMPYEGAALPETFYNIGANFSYGMMNKEYYTRVWRPYATFSPYYNGLLEEVNFSFSAGYGGHIYDKDHLTFGVMYDQSVNGTQDSTLEVYLRYRMFF